MDNQKLLIALKIKVDDLFKNNKKHNYNKKYSSPTPKNGHCKYAFGFQMPYLKIILTDSIDIIIGNESASPQGYGEIHILFSSPEETKKIMENDDIFKQVVNYLASIIIYLSSLEFCFEHMGFRTDYFYILDNSKLLWSDIKKTDTCYSTAFELHDGKSALLMPYKNKKKWLNISNVILSERFKPLYLDSFYKNIFHTTFFTEILNTEKIKNELNDISIKKIQKRMEEINQLLEMV